MFLFEFNKKMYIEIIKNKKVKMSQFIKLTSMILNKNLITSVFIKPNKYHIYTVENNINGFMILGSGGANSSPEKIVVCEKMAPEDYKSISKWIESI